MEVFEDAMAAEILKFNGDGDEDQAAYKAQTLHQLDPEVLDLALQKKLWPGTGFEAEIAQVSCPGLLLQADTAFGGVMDEDLSAISELKSKNWTWKRFEGVGHSIHYEGYRGILWVANILFSTCTVGAALLCDFRCPLSDRGVKPLLQFSIVPRCEYPKFRLELWPWI